MSHASWELGWCVFKGWPTIPGRQSEKFIRKDGENVVEIAFRSVAKKNGWMNYGFHGRYSYRSL